MADVEQQLAIRQFNQLAFVARDLRYELAALPRAAVVFAKRREHIFRGPAKLALALCVSILSVWGIDRTIIRLVVLEYNALGLTLLIALILLLVAWILISGKRHGSRCRDVPRRD